MQTFDLGDGRMGIQVTELMGSLDIEASLPTTLRHHALLPQLAVGDNRGMVRKRMFFP